jgi:hypothetical protein
MRKHVALAAILAVAGVAAGIAVAGNGRKV